MIGPRGGGGIASHINGLSKELERLGNQVSYLPPRQISSPLAVARYVRKLSAGFDVVHVHGSYEITGLTASVVASKALGIGTVYTTHGTGSRYWRQGRRWGGLWRETARRFDVVISVSEFVRKRMVEVLGENPPVHCTIPNGVDPRFFSPSMDPWEAKNAAGVPGGYVLLYLGRLARNKGIGHLLRATSLLRKEMKDVVLIVGGKGEMEEELRRDAAAYGISEDVKFRGYVPEDLLPAFFSASDVVVVPSTYEPGGIVPLEAMSMKRPVIGTRVGGIAESVADGETGLLVPPGDPEAIASAVRELRRSPGLSERFGENGRSLVERKFTWEKVARETLGAYALALSRG